MHPVLRMPAVGSGESWKLLKQRYDLTNVYLTKITEGRLEDGGWMGGYMDGWWMVRQMSAGVDGCGQRHGAGSRRTNQEVTLVQEKRDEGLGGGQRRADLRDSLPGEMRILKTS